METPTQNAAAFFTGCLTSVAINSLAKLQKLQAFPECSLRIVHQFGPTPGDPVNNSLVRPANFWLLQHLRAKERW
jgi:hypothetical protein